jgi:putative Holliday junction resolvase
MGVRIAFDVGTVRIGVATCDPDGILASPQAAIPAGDNSVSMALDLAAQYSAKELIVGLPQTLKGKETASAELVRAWACQLEAQGSFPVILVDERFTTVLAQNSFRAAGQNVKKTRSRIDSAAATVLLQGYLDMTSRSDRAD